MDANVESLSQLLIIAHLALDLPAKLKLALEDHVISSYGGVDKKYRSETVVLYNRLRIANAFRQ